MKTAEVDLLIFEGANARQQITVGAAWVDLPQANSIGQAEWERAGLYPLRSCLSEQRHNDKRWGPRHSLRSSPKNETIVRWKGENRQMTSAHWVKAILDEGSKACGFVAWYGALLRRLRVYCTQRGCSRRSRLIGDLFLPQRALCD